MCGIKARVDANLLEHETPDAKGDKSGLTEVQLRCCMVPPELMGKRMKKKRN